MEDIMALALGVKIGDVVDIADRWVAVLFFNGPHSATLICDDGEKLAVSADELTEMMPDVWIGLGPQPVGSKLKLLFEAPRNVPITRRRT
jgi:hypothetical protein